jgi:arylformamidase
MPVLVDLSHTIDHGMVTYKGLPAPLICDYLSREASRRLYSPGTEFQIGKIEMVGNTGTYLDSPFHRFADGKDLSHLSLDRLANLPCIVAHLDPFAARAIDELPLAASDVRGRAVLIDTGWARYWRTDQYFEGHPYVTGALAHWRNGSRQPVRCWSESTRTILTPRTTGSAPSIRRYCGRTFPSLSI